MRKKNFIWILVVILASIVLASCNAKTPNISSDLSEFEFGEVLNGEILTKDVLILNKGDSTLEIQDISSSCSCTTAEISSKSIEPNESAILTIQFDAGEHGESFSGEVLRKVFLSTNDVENPKYTIQFSAIILLKE